MKQGPSLFKRKRIKGTKLEPLKLCWVFCCRCRWLSESFVVVVRRTRATPSSPSLFSLLVRMLTIDESEVTSLVYEF